MVLLSVAHFQLYWTDAGLNSIEVCELDGRNRKVLVWSGLDKPRSIVLHYPEGVMFWSDWGQNARIERAGMDGSDRTAVVTENLSWPNGLSIDLMKNKLYWNDAKKKVIETSDLQGENRKVLMYKVEHPYGLAVMGDFVYWSDWLSKAIFKANKTDGSNKVALVKNLEGAMDVRAINVSSLGNLQVQFDPIHDLSRQYQTPPVSSEDVCGHDNGGCSHLCLRNPRRQMVCACPTGIVLNNDGRTCNATPTNFLLFANKKSLTRMSFDTPDMKIVHFPVKNVHALSIDFHWEKGLIFYVDVTMIAIRYWKCLWVCNR